MSTEMTALEYASSVAKAEMNEMNESGQSFDILKMIQVMFNVMGLVGQEQIKDARELEKFNKKEKKIFLNELTASYRSKKIYAFKMAGAVTSLGSAPLGVYGYNPASQTNIWFNAPSAAGGGLQAIGGTMDNVENAVRTEAQVGKEDIQSALQGLGGDKSRLDQLVSEMFRNISEASQKMASAVR